MAGAGDVNHNLRRRRWPDNFKKCADRPFEWNDLLAGFFVGKILVDLKIAFIQLC